MPDLNGDRANKNAVSARVLPLSQRHAATANFHVLSESSVHACLFGVTQPLHLILEMEFAPFQFGDFEIGIVSGGCSLDFLFEGRVLVHEAGQLR